VTEAPPGAIDAIRDLAHDGTPLVAIGETGLDFYRNLSPRVEQEDLFRAHIGLACELGLPLVVHSREATDRVLEILEEELAGRDHTGGVLHCFSGDRRAAGRAADLGFHLGVGGTLTYDDHELAQVVSRAPAWQLLLETDAPYLAPAPHRRERNEPAHLVIVRELVADLREEAAEGVEATTTENACRLFRLPASVNTPAKRVGS
jgi:TatD DNase family protein